MEVGDFCRVNRFSDIPDDIMETQNNTRICFSRKEKIFIFKLGKKYLAIDLLNGCMKRRLQILKNYSFGIESFFNF